MYYEKGLQARIQFEQWKRRFSGRRVIVPYQPSHSGEVLKCPACGSTEDFVLYVERSVGAPIPKVNKQRDSDRAVYLKCFAPPPHLMGSDNYTDMRVLAKYLRDGDRLIPVEDYKPLSIGGSKAGALLQLAFLI